MYGTLITGLLCAFVRADLVGIPTVPFTTSGTSGYSARNTRQIVVDQRYANVTDTHGYTLMPPTLSQFAATFSSDLCEVLGVDHLSAVTGDGGEPHSIFLTLDNCTEYRDAAGRWTSEAYSITVTPSAVVVSGASPLGVWWGTRTVLQQAALHNGSIPTGSGVDSPGWGTRGVMLDGGRHYYPPGFIVEMCAWLSYYKQNTFHLHLSDNLYDNPNYTTQERLELYARFRLLSDDPAVAGLNKHPNESYTRQDFDYMQFSCAARGVTIIPEIEAPGHALVISQWKPELGLEGALDLLNISYPSTIPTMETIWLTFLPWLHSKVAHIGADEYVDSDLSTYELATEYNYFVNTLNDYIGNVSGKNIRIWGTYPPQANYTDNISKDVVIQHWEFFDDNPLYDYIDNGYTVLNSDDAFYIVQKYSTSYPQELNITTIFHGNPATGGPYAPYVFDTKNASNNPQRDNPYVLGQVAAQWNDYGYNTSTYLEAYYSWQDGLPALADKQWGGTLTEEQYAAVYEKLQMSAPAQNLDRRIKSITSTILEYDVSTSTDGHSGAVKDLSGNGYDGRTSCSITNGSLVFEDNCTLTTPLGSKGADYTLSFSVLPKTYNAPLFRGPDSELRNGNGTSTQLMLISAGNAFPLNYSLPLGEWTEGKLIGRGNKTFFAAEGGMEMEFTTKIGVNGEYFAWARMAVVAPLRTVGGGGFEGQIDSIKLVDSA